MAIISSPQTGIFDVLSSDDDTTLHAAPSSTLNPNNRAMESGVWKWRFRGNANKAQQRQRTDSVGDVSEGHDASMRVC